MLFCVYLAFYDFQWSYKLGLMYILCLRNNDYVFFFLLNIMVKQTKKPKYSENVFNILIAPHHFFFIFQAHTKLLKCARNIIIGEPGLSKLKIEVSELALSLFWNISKYSVIEFVHIDFDRMFFIYIRFVFYFVISNI